MSKRGKYIVIEGADAVGKTTQINLLKERFEQEGIDAIFTHEPGGTKLGMTLRKELFDPANEASPLTQLHLFTANRIDIWEKVIEPNINMGRIVVSDRSWYSSLAYQGYGGKLAPKQIEEITTASLPKEYITPDIALVLLLTAEERKQRNGARNVATDTFELMSEEYFVRVRDGYEDIVRTKGAIGIAGSGDRELIHQDMWKHIERLINR